MKDFNKKLSEILRLIRTNNLIEAFKLLNSISYNEHDEFSIDVHKYFRVGSIERKNHRGYMFRLYFIDVYDDSPRCHFYRTLGKLYTNIETNIDDISIKDIKKYFIPQFIEILEIYLKEEE